jgi:hypothetical protein
LRFPKETPVKLRVQCYAGHRGEEEPRAFYLGDRRIEVMKIIDRWLSPEHRYFRVQAYDGSVYILRHDETAGEWELTELISRNTERCIRPNRHCAGEPDDDR